MDNDLLLALTLALAESAETKRGPRGQRGKNGKDFSLEESLPLISYTIRTYVDQIAPELKLRFEDLTPEEKQSLKGADGESFQFAKCEGQIRSIIEEYRLKFSDFTEEQKDELKLKFSQLTDDEKNSLKLKFSDLSVEEVESIRGRAGRDGKDFSYEREKENIVEDLTKIVKSEKDNLKLKFSDLTEEEKLSLKGSRGQRGKQGDPFTYANNKEDIDKKLSEIFQDNRELLKLKFSHLTEEEKEELKLRFENLSQEDKESLRLRFEHLSESEKDSLKLKFSDLTEEERISLKGSRGQRGKQGPQGIQGEVGPQGIQGPRGAIGIGLNGLNGRDGRDGKDGEDGVSIVRVELEDNIKDFYFLVHYSNGVIQRTESIAKPQVTQHVHQSIIIPPSTNAISRIVLSKTATENILRGQVVRADSDTSVVLSDSTTSTDARSLGVALNDALTGETVQALVFGTEEFTEFSALPVNSPLFLQADSSLNTTPPLTGYSTYCAKHLGNGTILVNVSEPIGLGA